MALIFVKADVKRPDGKSACARIDCPNTFESHGAQRYCSRHCSVLTRNRRYHETYKGRMNKRASASRYFHNHRQELYGKRRDRMEGYVQEILSSVPLDSLAMEGRTFGKLGLTLPEYAELQARETVRIQHDWHGGAHDGSLPRPRWETHPWGER